MPKAGKSSASSATRKKQAAKAAARKDDGGPPAPKAPGAPAQKKMQRGERKAAKKNKKPVYIPPPKPPQPTPDPLDALGLAPLLPPDLVVLLRKASKKDVITRARALEGLLEYITAEPPEADDGGFKEKESAMVIMLPCWAHLFPRLSISPTRRLRLLTAQIHATLLQPSRATRPELLLSPQYTEPMVGPWAVLAYDADRTVSRIARTAWEDAVRWENLEQDTAEQLYHLNLSEHNEALFGHLRTILLSFSPSASLFASSAFNPMPPTSATPSGSGTGTPARDDVQLSRDAKSRDDVNVEEDADATDKRLAAGALGALVWTIDTFWDVVNDSGSLEEIVTSQILWDCLSIESTDTSLGRDAPLVRSRLWDLFGAITKQSAPLTETVIAATSSTLMSSAWQEDDSQVIRSMLEALLPQLRKQPDLWTTPLPTRQLGVSRNATDAADDSAEESSEEEDEDVADNDGDHDPPVLAEPPTMLDMLLDWLRLIAPTSPQLIYPAVLVIISTLPRTVFSPTAAASSALLEALYEPIYTRSFELEGPAAHQGVLAWVTSFTECTSFLVRRFAKIGIPDETESVEAAATHLATRYLGLVWNDFVLPEKGEAPSRSIEGDIELSTRRLARAYKVLQPQDLAATLGATIIQLSDLDETSKVSRELLRIYHESISNFLSNETTLSHDSVSERQRSGLDRAIATLAVVSSGTSRAPAASLRPFILEQLLQVLQHACKTINEVATSLTSSSSAIETNIATRNVLFVSAAATLLHESSSAAPSDLYDETLKMLHHTLLTSLPALTKKQLLKTSDFTSFIAGCLPVFHTSLGPDAVQQLARSSLEAILAIPDDVERATGLFNAMSAFSAACQDGQLGESLAVAGMEDAILELASTLCSERRPKREECPESWQLLPRILDQPDPFVSPSIADDVLTILISTIEHLGTSVVAGLAAGQTEAQSLTVQLRCLELPLATLEAWLSPTRALERSQRILTTPLFVGLLPVVFQLAYLAPCLDSSHTVAASCVVSPSKAVLQAVHQNSMDALYKQGSEILREQLLAMSAPASAVFDAFRNLTSDAGVQPISRGPYLPLLPTPARLQQLLVDCAGSTPARPSLAILDQLVHPSAMAFNTGHTVYNAAGMATFPVCISVLLKSLDDELISTNFSLEVSLLPHLTAFALMLEDHLTVPLTPPAVGGPFNSSASATELQKLLQHTVQVITRALSDSLQQVDQAWHIKVTKTIKEGKTSREGLPSDANEDQPNLSDVLASLWQLAADTTSDRAHELLTRTFSRLLSGIMNFSSAGEAEALCWLEVAQAARTKHVSLTCAILTVLGPLTAHLSKHDRLRNDIASRLAGVSAADASTTGADLLRIQLASAPPPEMGIAILPTQRAIFLLQTIARWLASDEEISEDVNTYCANLFVQLAPVVQDMAGSHIDLLFDLCESNLAVGSFEDETSLPGLYHGLRLVETLRDLAMSNKILREVWLERKGELYEHIRELYFSLVTSATPAHTIAASIPQDAVVTLLTDLTRDITASFTNEKDGTVLARLVTSTAHHPDVQISAYKLLSAQIKEQVRELVVDLAVGGSSRDTETYTASEAVAAEERTTDSDTPAKGTSAISKASPPKREREIILAPILLETASAVLDSASVTALLEPGESAGRRATLGLLLSWLAIFDHFLEASLQVKAAYITELEKGDTVARSLLPSCFALMNAIVEGKPFDAGRWAVDEIYFEDLDTEDVHVLQVLAGHVYLRSLQHLPTLVRNWWFSLKDRQLSSAVSTFTVKYCSPSIAARELAALREPDALSRLEDEAMSVRVMGNNEVVATYVVDEHPIELSVRIPTDFPLHAIEIRDPADASKRVGISEAQWRAWILAVQQLITSGNGLVFDAILLFKKNAEAKFAGFEGAECAICYSIISPTDRSLPVKPCQTCKNKFHASCLFKWVNTSGSSTCPLCRSVL